MSIAHEKKQLIDSLTEMQKLDYILDGKLPTSIQAKMQELERRERFIKERRSEESKIARSAIAAAHIGLTYDEMQRVKTESWTAVALVLPVYEYNCSTCNATYTAPNTTVLLEQRHSVLGLHMKSVSCETHRDAFATLPRRKQIISVSVCDCPRCFDIETLVVKALEAKEDTAQSVEGAL